MKDETKATIKEFKLTESDVAKARFDHEYNSLALNKKIAINYQEYQFQQEKFRRSLRNRRHDDNLKKLIKDQEQM